MKKLILVMWVVAFGGVAYAQAPDAAALRKTCADAMNADPEFAKSIATTVDKQLDQKTIEQHKTAADKIAQNERHVIISYAAMWVIAALFVGFMWRRQLRLRVEIGQLRKELESKAAT